MQTRGTKPGTGCHGYQGKKFYQVIYISKTHVRALDNPDQRCSNKGMNPNTSACIARFVNDKLGCNTMILGSQYTKTSPCITKSQLLALANMTRVLKEADGNDIYEMTGCLSSCEKDRYSVSAEPTIRAEELWSSPLTCQVHFEFIMQESSYHLEEQYHLYDIPSFLADIGGYMGLLLGSSLLGIYMSMEDLLRKLCCNPFKGKLIENKAN